MSSAALCLVSTGGEQFRAHDKSRATMLKVECPALSLWRSVVRETPKISLATT